MTRDPKDRHSWRKIPGRVIEEARRRAGFTREDAGVRPANQDIGQHNFQGGSTLRWQPALPRAQDRVVQETIIVDSEYLGSAAARAARQSTPSVREALATIDAAAAQRSAQLQRGALQNIEEVRLAVDADEPVKSQGRSPLQAAHEELFRQYALRSKSEAPPAQALPEVSDSGCPMWFLLCTLLVVGLGLAYVGRVEQSTIASGVLQTSGGARPVRAQTFGLVSTLELQPGDGVARRAARALVFAPAKDAALLHPGLAASLEFASLPVSELGKVPARVTRVSRYVASAEEISSALGRTLDEPLVRVELSLLESSRLTRLQDKLRTGERVTARLNMRKRRVVSLLFDFLARGIHKFSRNE